MSPTYRSVFYVHMYICLQSRPDFKIRQQLVQEIVKEKGQTLVTRLLHASVYSLSSYMLGEVADVILELAMLDRGVRR